MKDDAQVYGDALVFESALVSEQAKIFGEAQVFGDSRISGAALIYLKARVFGKATVSGKAKVGGSATINCRAVVLDNCTVFGEAIVSGKARLSRYVQLFDKARVLTSMSRGQSACGDVTLKPIYIESYSYPITIADNSLVVGCRSYTFDDFKQLTYSMDISAHLNRDEFIKGKNEILKAIHLREKEMRDFNLSPVAGN